MASESTTRVRMKFHLAREPSGGHGPGSVGFKEDGTISRSGESLSRLPSRHEQPSAGHHQVRLMGTARLVHARSVSRQPRRDRRQRVQLGRLDLACAAVWFRELRSWAGQTRGRRRSKCPAPILSPGFGLDPSRDRRHREPSSRDSHPEAARPYPSPAGRPSPTNSDLRLAALGGRSPFRAPDPGRRR